MTGKPARTVADWAWVAAAENGAVLGELAQLLAAARSWDAITQVVAYEGTIVDRAKPGFRQGTRKTIKRVWPCLVLKWRD